MTSNSPPIKIGTRGSALALTQAHAIKAELERLGAQAQITVIKTKGDKDQVQPFAQVGAPGLFVRELEQALIEARVDLAVHCYKDLPSDSPQSLCVVACPPREDARDRLLIRAQAHAPDAAGLPLQPGAKVGTASARRIALVRDLRPDLECVHLRGNVPTRVAKLQEGEYDAILLASAGLNRLEIAHLRGECPALPLDGLIQLDLDPQRFVPAPSQGALALQVRRDDGVTSALVQQLDQSADHLPVRAERSLLALVEAGCQVPFGAYATYLEDGNLELIAALEIDGQMRRASATGQHVEELAQRVHDLLLPERLK